MLGNIMVGLKRLIKIDIEQVYREQGDNYVYAYKTPLYKLVV